MRITLVPQPRPRTDSASGWTLGLLLFTRRGGVSDSYRQAPLSPC